jgi:hypothetical protein
MFEIVAGPGGPLHYPVPWADGPHESFLISSDELRQVTDQAGVQVAAWTEGPDALAEIGRTAEAIPARQDDRGIGLHLLMPDFEQRMAGLARNVGEQRIALVQAVLEAA